MQQAGHANRLRRFPFADRIKNIIITPDAYSILKNAICQEVRLMKNKMMAILLVTLLFTYFVPLSHSNPIPIPRLEINQNIMYANVTVNGNNATVNLTFYVVLSTFLIYSFISNFSTTNGTISNATISQPSNYEVLNECQVRCL